MFSFFPPYYYSIHFTAVLFAFFFLYLACSGEGDFFSFDDEKIRATNPIRMHTHTHTQRTHKRKVGNFFPTACYLLFLLFSASSNLHAPKGRNGKTNDQKKSHHKCFRTMNNVYIDRGRITTHTYTLHITYRTSHTHMHATAANE